MARQTINVGAAANDGTGDTERAAWIKANANFGELYDAAHRLPRLDKAADYTLLQGDAGRFVRADASGGAIVLTLPASGAADGDVLRVGKMDASANRVTVRTSGGGDLGWLSAAGDHLELAWWNGGWTVTRRGIQPLRQRFVSSGTSTRPPLAIRFDVALVGGGGGGGGGRCSETGNSRPGGAGGGAAAAQYLTLPAASHGTTEAVTIGAGGTAGAAAGAAAANGTPGGPGGVTSLGGLVRAEGGAGGTGGGSATTSAGGAAPVVGTFGASGNGGNAASTSNGIAGGRGAVGGGGGGGSMDAANVLRQPAAGGFGSGHSVATAMGGSQGSNGTRQGGSGADITDADIQMGGGGGGGGYFGSSANGGGGGDGGAPGGGGGGGGACDAGFVSGPGGKGGRGELRLTWYFN